MDGTYRISQVAERLGVTPQYLRMLEWEGRVPPARRDFNGRIYTEFDVALFRSLGIGTRPKRLKSAEELLEAAR